MNVYIREFLKKKRKPIVYCSFLENEGKSPKSVAWVLEQLRIPVGDPVEELVHIVPFYNSDDLCLKLETIISRKRRNKQ